MMERDKVMMMRRRPHSAWATMCFLVSLMSTPRFQLARQPAGAV